MKVYQNTDELPPFKHAVVTIGTFDGVHLGHKQIIHQLIREAGHVEGTAVLMTFYPHPKRVVSTDMKPIYLLNTAEEKYELLHKAGIGHIVVVPFNEEFANQPPVDYIRDFLVGKLHAKTIIIGYDHRFGKNREGDYHMLDALSATFGYTVKEIPERLIRNITISSTRIREALLTGDIAKAEEFLGYPYFFSGKVVEGNKLGRTIGYPTANLEINDPEKLIPANAVYAVLVKHPNHDGLLKGMMNIGTRPTVNGTRRMIEVNLFDVDEDLYGLTLTVTLKKKLRDEVKFDGLNELKNQLAKDKQSSLLALQF